MGSRMDTEMRGRSEHDARSLFYRVSSHRTAVILPTVAIRVLPQYNACSYEC
jgi:hypothetical protein